MADIKITGYAELAAPISTDLVEVVSDPGGTPISKKVQIRNLFKGGGQIAFPATAVPSADANTLDDYEKGIFVVTLDCVTSGSYTLDASEDSFAYVKVGDKVSCQGRLSITGESSPSGQLRASIPFTESVAETQSVFCVIQDHGGTIVNPFGILSATQILLYDINDSGIRSNITQASVDTVFKIYFCFTYLI